MGNAASTLKMSLTLYPRDESQKVCDSDIPILCIYAEEKHMHMHQQNFRSRID